MSVIEFNQVWKKFKKGEKIESLRDAIPYFFRKAINNNGLKKNEFWALEDVNFAVEKGEIVGIIGPNGAGKSTTLKLLSGIFAPNQGTMKIHGRMSALIEVTAGFHPELTGRENIYLNGTILGMKKKEIDSKFDEIVEFSGIGEFIDTPVKRYSSGMFSRLGFSVAAHMDPDILLVDEVLAVGDISFQAKCAEKMRELMKGGATIVLVSHNLSLIRNLCKRAILFNKGKKQKEGSPEDVIPYYENIVFKQRENEIKNQLTSSEYKVQVKDESLILINSVFMYDGESNKKENFKIGENILLKVEFEAKELISNPVFSLDIIRPDGVLCCSSITKHAGFSIESIKDKGTITIDLGRINLTQGIYILRICILDNDLIHPYAIRKEDILRMEFDRSDKRRSGVFLPEIKWKLET